PRSPAGGSHDRLPKPPDGLGDQFTAVNGSGEQRPPQNGDRLSPEPDAISGDPNADGPAAVRNLVPDHLRLAGARSPEWRERAVSRSRDRILRDTRARREAAGHEVEAIGYCPARHDHPGGVD